MATDAVGTLNGNPLRGGGSYTWTTMAQSRNGFDFGEATPRGVWGHEILGVASRASDSGA